MTAVYIIMMIAAVVMLLPIIPINIIADFSYKSENNTLYVKFLFFKLKLYPKISEVGEKLEKDYEEHPEETDKKAADILSMLKSSKKLYAKLKNNIKKLLDYVFEHAITIKHVNISAVIGTGDAMYTGISTGAANAAVYGALGASSAKMKIKKYHVDIKPEFDRAYLAAGIYAMVYTRIFYVFGIAVRLIRLYMIYRKINKSE